MKTHPLRGEDVRSWREIHNVSQEELGKLLDTSREWIGMIERGDRPISAAIYLRFENLKREPRFRSDSSSVSGGDFPPIPPASVVAGGSPGILARQARTILENTLDAAGTDLAKLGWVREQLRSHLAVPAHWNQLKGPLVPVTLPSQTQLLSSKTGKPIPTVPPASRSAQAG